MEVEKIFNGPPEKFLEMAQIWATRRLWENDPYSWRIDPEGYNFLYLWDVKKQERTFVSIKAQNLPADKALLIIRFPDEQWPELRMYWDRLYDEMVRQGWIESQPLNSSSEKEIGKTDKFEDVTNSKEQITTPQSNKTEFLKQILEKVGDKEWDRMAVELWWQGYTAREIGAKVQASEGRVTNRISELRQKYGKKIVPLDRERRKTLRESRYPV